MKPKKTLSNWLTNRYLLIIRNEEDFAEKSTISFNYAKVLVLCFLAFTLMLILSLFLTKSILAQWFDPRHSQVEMGRKLLTLSLSVDSLADEVAKKDQFISNFQLILSGGDSLEQYNPEEVDGRYDVERRMEGEELLINQLTPIDSQFRREFEESGFDVGSLTSYARQGSNLQELYFFTPIEGGIISDQYDARSGHFGVDIVAKNNEPVKCVADGTVIFASWTQDSGYVIAVQHSNNIISIYKHNSDLLKNVGNFVSGGEIISIIGNTGELTSGPHLHFELWYNGNPVDPAEFVSL